LAEDKVFTIDLSEFRLPTKQSIRERVPEKPKKHYTGRRRVWTPQAITLGCYSNSAKGPFHWDWCSKEEVCLARKWPQPLSDLGLEYEGMWRCSGFGQPYFTSCQCPRCVSGGGCEDWLFGLPVSPPEFRFNPSLGTWVEVNWGRRFHYYLVSRGGYWVGQPEYKSEWQLNLEWSLPLPGCLTCAWGQSCGSFLAPCPRCEAGPWWFVKRFKEKMAENDVPPPNWNFFLEETTFRLEEGFEIMIAREMDKRGIRDWRVRELMKEEIAREVYHENLDYISRVITDIERRLRKLEKRFGSLDEALHLLQHYMEERR